MLSEKADGKMAKAGLLEDENKTCLLNHMFMEYIRIYQNVPDTEHFILWLDYNDYELVKKVKND